MAPQWLIKYKLVLSLITLSVTGLLLGIHSSRPELIKRRNDPNRIRHLKTAMELEEADFLKMSSDLKLSYDPDELKAVEREALSAVRRE